MTMALCFNCGETKFGAICPCMKCHVASTGNIELEIAFSDHHLSVATLKAFGDVVRQIATVCEASDLRFWSFLRYISLHHSDILRIDQPPEQQAACDEVLAQAKPRAVVVEKPSSRRGPRPPERPGGLRGPRRWWRFWQ